MDEFSLRVNGDAFRDRVVSRYSIREAVSYIEVETEKGDDQFLVLANNNTDSFVQTILLPEGFHVEVPVRKEDGANKLVEKNGLSKKEVLNLFYMFIEGAEIDVEEYSELKIISGKKKL